MSAPRRHPTSLLRLTVVLAASALIVVAAGGNGSPASAAPSAAVRPMPSDQESAVASGIDVRDTRMLHQPAIHGDRVAFLYADDLWIANLDGSDVRRLTTHVGTESRPRFSPDGSLIAFSGEYDGNVDVYVVPAEGGMPDRLTWHPYPDRVHDFTPDGSAVLFGSARSVHTSRFRHLYTVPLEGGPPERLPLPTGYDASYSPDGSRIAYTPLSERFEEWKNYRGGTISRIWIYDVADHSVVEVPKPAGGCNDTDPVWLGGKIVFRSDRAGEFNLFAYDPGSGELEQLTRHDDFPVLSLSTDGERIAYEQAGWLHLWEPAASGEEASSRRLRIGVATDLLELRSRYADGARWIRNHHVSPSAARAVFEFRGEIVTVPADKGSPRDITGTPGVHERSPAWSPDGKRIAYFSDAAGEYELHVAPQDGRGEVRTYPIDGAGFYEDPKWSPDGEKISFTDNSWSLYWIDLDSGEVTKVAQEPIYGPIKTLHHAWSPDSRWIAYTLTNKTYFQRVHLYSLEDDASHEITEGLSDAGEPVFDPGGDYLYVYASTDAGPVRQWFAQSSADMEWTRGLYLIVLDSGQRSPLAPESDEAVSGDGEVEEDGDDGDGASDEDDGGNGEGGSAGAGDGGDAQADDVPEVTIDFDGIAQRIVALPLPERNYFSLQPGPEGKLYYLRTPRAGMFQFFGGGEPPTLARFDLESREEEVLLEGARAYALSGDGSKLLVSMGENWLIADAGKIDPSKGKIAVDEIEVKIDPRAEWEQIFREVWRINRDWFYAPNMHGADWPAMQEKYERYLPHLTTRSDLNRVLEWLGSELAVGHHRVGGGDTRDEPESVPGGLLGADYEVHEGRYRFAKVYGGLNWNPDLRAPLTEPGVDVEAGEYLLEVEGRELRPPENLYARFENTAGKTVEITVGPNTDGSDSRTVRVVPVESDIGLRNRDWVEGNIDKVHEATDGRVAYVYVPDTAVRGHTYFKRYFFPQAHKDAIIVDERYNSGGLVADYYIDILRRQRLAWWNMRHGDDIPTPIAGIPGPKVMIIDETAGSGGDFLPFMFRKLDLGPLIGKRTWGGLVGTLGFPILMDGGYATAPNLAIWTEEGGWVVENEGVAPDIEVEQWPAEVIAGRDPQLEKAIEVVLQMLEENAPSDPEHPPYPVRVRQEDGG